MIDINAKELYTQLLVYKWKIDKAWIERDPFSYRYHVRMTPDWTKLNGKSFAQSMDAHTTVHTAEVNLYQDQRKWIYE